jgi:hypothetical protein
MRQSNFNHPMHRETFQNNISRRSHKAREKEKEKIITQTLAFFFNLRDVFLF